jgi:tetratricopeptide (TPR) repeat protein
MSDNKDSLPELIKKFWVPIAGFLGAVTLAYNFYQLWRGDQATVTWLLAGGGLLLIFIVSLWIIFKQKSIHIEGIPTPKKPNPKPRFEKQPEYSRFHRLVATSSLALLGLLAIAGTVLLLQHWQEQERIRAELEEKLIVVIAAFDGPEEVYGLRNEIIESLNASFFDDNNILILSIDEVITPGQGENYARHIGEQQLADVVIWGWYRPTENPNITIHVENLSPQELGIVNERKSLRPSVILQQLESFTFQQRIGAEISAFIHTLMGFLEFQMSNYQESINQFDTAISKLPQQPLFLANQVDIYFYRATAEALLGNNTSAIDDYQAVILLKQDELVTSKLEISFVFNNRGIVYGNMGSYQQAIQDFDTAINHDPKYSPAYNNRGLVYGQIENYSQAIQDLNRAIQLNMQYADAYNNRGTIYADMENYQQAIQDFEKAIMLAPQNAGAYHNLGKAYSNIGNYDQAIRNFGRAIEIAPQYAPAYNDLGIVYFRGGEYLQAIDEYNKALDINPLYIVVYNNLGNAYAALGNWQLAFSNYEKAIQQDSLDATAYYNRGFAYYSTGDYERAIADYNIAISINPQYAEAYSNRGLAYSQQQDYQRAIEDYTKAIQIDSQLSEAYGNRAIAYFKIDELLKAIQDFDKAIQLDPQFADAYSGRGITYHLLGRTDEANADFAKYIELTGQDSP